MLRKLHGDTRIQYWIKIIYMSLIFAILMMGCAGNAANGSIDLDGTIYTYEIVENTLKITYPNGVIYTQKYFDSDDTTGYVAGYSGDIGEVYPDGSTLADAILKHERSNTFTLPKLLLCAIGSVMLFAPKFIWSITYGWIFRDATPSRKILGLIRGIGLVTIFSGVVLILGVV